MKLSDKNENKNQRRLERCRMRKKMLIRKKCGKHEKKVERMGIEIRPQHQRNRRAISPRFTLGQWFPIGKCVIELILTRKKKQ